MSNDLYIASPAAPATRRTCRCPGLTFPHRRASKGCYHNAMTQPVPEGYGDNGYAQYDRDVADWMYEQGITPEHRDD